LVPSPRIRTWSLCSCCC